MTFGKSLRSSGLHLAVALLTTGFQAVAQDAIFSPPAAMVLDNVPAVPASVAAQVARYTEFKPTSFATWHPVRREMILVRRYKNTPQLYRLPQPGAAMELLTDYPEPVRGASYEPKQGKYYVFSKDSGGNEVFRGYRRDVASGEAVPITPAGQRVESLAWANSGRQFVYVTVPVNRQGSGDKITSTLYLADPLKPDAPKKLAEFAGGGWGEFDFSPNDRQLAYQEYVSASESYLWVMDVATGKARRIAEKNGSESVAWGSPKFGRNGRGVYTTSDKDSEFGRLTWIDLATLKSSVLTPAINWEVDSIDLSADGKMIAFVVNEDGNSVLRLMRTDDHKLVPAPKLPIGTIRSVEWHKNSRDLGFSLTSATSPSEAYSIDVKTSTVTRWTTHETMAVDATKFVEPSLIRWKSFDGRSISGFAYRAPAAKFPGKRPVLINIHGGPEGQFQPGFQGRNNYFTDEMGITVIFPNVRGSSGYGKTFLKLDNGKLREDSVKDIGALMDWIATQPDLDASKVAVTGGSYGGYMSLAVSTMYSERIAAAIDIVGISNFVTFLEKTESYRRDLRRVEYGDERDPDMRKFMEAIAPLNNAAKIKKPLFVVQGKNDPRVPYQEADQIVATVKKSGTPVWYMMANDEGHGFGKKANADYQFYSTIGFLNTYLTPTSAGR
jgi:dipeptidyl aminopeptidase/acylaminoacyl peptidase